MSILENFEFGSDSSDVEDKETFTRPIILSLQDQTPIDSKTGSFASFYSDVDLKSFYTSGPYSSSHMQHRDSFRDSLHSSSPNLWRKNSPPTCQQVSDDYRLYHSNHQYGSLPSHLDRSLVTSFDARKTDDGFGNVVVNSFSPVFSSAPILPFARSNSVSTDHPKDLKHFASPSPVAGENSWPGSKLSAGPEERYDSYDGYETRPKQQLDYRPNSAASSHLSSDDSCRNSVEREPAIVPPLNAQFGSFRLAENPGYCASDVGYSRPYSKFSHQRCNSDSGGDKKQFSTKKSLRLPVEHYVSYNSRLSLDSNPVGRSHLKILHDNTPNSSLRSIQEEDELHSNRFSAVSSLKRAFSSPSREQMVRLSGFESTDSIDIAIFSLHVLKLSKKGRLLRFDGTLLVCMSGNSGIDRTTCISETDFLQSSYPTIRYDFHIAIRDNYPAGSPVSSLAKCLISSGKGICPKATSYSFYIPKWVIPVKDIIRIQYSNDANVFSIVTHDQEYTLKAYNFLELNTITQFLESCSNFVSDLQSSPYSASIDLEQVHRNQEMRMQDFLNQQRNWKAKLARSLENERLRPWVTTVKIEAIGIQNLRGIVIVPPLRKKYENSPTVSPGYSRFHRRQPIYNSMPRKIAVKLENSDDISDQIAALDREILQLRRLAK